MSNSTFTDDDERRPRAGYAFCAGPVSIMAIMACRWASARVRPVFAAASIRVVRATAASETTGQCETRRARLPAEKNAFASPGYF